MILKRLKNSQLIDMSSTKEICGGWIGSHRSICRQGFAEGSPLTARSANTSNFAITRFCDQAYKLPSALCVQGPEIERHLELTGYVIAEWHLLSSLQRRRNGSTAPLPKLLVGTCEAHHFIVSGGRRSSADTYALRATTGGSAVRSESDLSWRRVSA